MAQSYFVKAIWEPEARVWISETDIPGLVIESDTLAEFEALMMRLAPEMLAENEGLHDASVAIDFQVSDRREVMVA
ncbi:MAG: DUF1902 domain-containing protein [Pseudomonadota bacterium]|nr:DUF1902 domain-containing protein [Pseudomonadota bacterium]